jgi:hypothetical protein
MTNTKPITTPPTAAPLSWTSINEAAPKAAAAADYIERTLPALAATAAGVQAAAQFLAAHYMRRSHQEHARFSKLETACSEFLNATRS